MEFKTGDIVVEPTIGICKVEGIRRMTVDGQVTDFFVFHAPNNTNVYVPRAQILKRGVRKPMSKEEAKKIMSSLKMPTSISREDPRQNYTKYRETINSGDPNKISKLLRELWTLDQSNELKGKEREIMEQARRFLTDEITHITGEPKVKILEDVDENLKQMYKKKVQKDREQRKRNSSNASA